MTRLVSLITPMALFAVLLLAPGCDEGEVADRPPPMETASLLMADVDREDPATSAAELAELVSDHTAFAFWLFHKGIEAEGANENLLFSPHSIVTAFSMLWPGALGDTADEIAEMLHFAMEPAAFHPASNRLDGELASRNDYEPSADEGEAPVLEIVNDIWGLADYPYVDEYLELLARHYGAGMWIVDFRNAWEEARQEINAHITYKTRGLIEELLPKNSIDRFTRLVLTNAIYFKGAWQFPFEDGLTDDAPFTALGGVASDVPMMSGEIDGASYGVVDGAEAVELAYVGNDLSMLLILPEESTYADFEAGFDAQKLDDVISSLTSMGGSLSMPRFEFDSELDLVEIFTKEGFGITFDPEQADFRGLSEVALEEELHVTGAFHKAAIIVDEEGTEAAAATAIVVGMPTSAPIDSFNVRLDRPFLFLIRDRPTGSILFMGRMVDAAAAQP